MAHDVLVEIGTEELPPVALKSLALAFRDSIEASLAEASLAFAGIRWFATPRRLAVIIDQLAGEGPAVNLEVFGPPADRARDENGAWTKAAIGFAQNNGVAPEALDTADTPKGQRLVYRATRPGAKASEVLADIVESALQALPIPKRMRWGASRTEFVRPVHWVVLMLDSQVLDADILGFTPTNITRGHRFHCDTFLDIANPSTYEKLLEGSGHVIPCFEKRREMIREQVVAEGKKLGGAAVISDDLLDEVTALVEWPVALAGSFEERFLDVPAEALISSMKEHQKYFHVEDDNGRLLPHFITVANIDSEDPAQVIRGNERVIRPRLSDAAFFFETDKKTPLALRVDKLQSIVFQDKLGTLYEKVERIRALSLTIADLTGANSGLAERAGELCKADLASDMVLEFDKMQGIAGRYYALADGEDPEVADAIRDHYLPKFAGDTLPATLTGCAVALADRLDTIVGIFGIHQKPTGSRDPFAIRRASISVLRILVDKNLDLDLRDLLKIAAFNYGPKLSDIDSLVSEALDYMIERFRATYVEEHIPVEVFMAVSAKQLSRPLDIDRRVKAVHAFNQLPEAQALAAANKRVSNILAKLDDDSALGDVNDALLSEPAEKALARQLKQKQQALAPLFANRQYREALTELAGLRMAVDTFFDEVMVMADSDAVKNNRLALLRQLRELFLEIADISYLVPNA